MCERSIKKKEFPFIPRIINPVKIKNVVIFSADEQIRQTKYVLEKSMPWVTVKIISDPISAGNYQSEEAMVLIMDDVALNLVDTSTVKHKNKDAVVVLLSATELIHCSPPAVAQEKLPYTAKADLVFAFNKTDCAPGKIIQSVVRSAEDLLNISEYSNVRRYIFLIVDDEPRWFSQFYPILYGIIGQRADVMIVRTYEEALNFLFGVEKESDIDDKQFIYSGHGDDVVCLITDIFFPKENEIKSDAGKHLIKLIQNYYPRIPIIIASKTKEAEAFKDSVFVLPKGDPGSLITLRKYIQDYTGMGDFLIQNETGEVLYRIKNIKEMIKILEKAGKNTAQAMKLRERLEEYGRRDCISTWLYMHSFRELGDVLRPMRVEGQRMIAVLKKHLKNEVHRMASTPLYIDKKKASNLSQLLHLLKVSDPGKIQSLSDNDVFSSWLDRKGFTELAEELRPIHGTGQTLIKSLTSIIEKWIHTYEEVL
ncbi:MAG: hypothetical protein JSV17_15035 [Candidatus Aminicenantes bacterium]|nr:MAG: hypothetical protein JSV17_15035 [Candidatus Aminicenantes bacterium]